jgi:hypothetical protein
VWVGGSGHHTPQPAIVYGLGAPTHTRVCLPHWFTDPHASLFTTLVHRPTTESVYHTGSPTHTGSISIGAPTHTRVCLPHWFTDPHWFNLHWGTDPHASLFIGAGSDEQTPARDLGCAAVLLSCCPAVLLYLPETWASIRVGRARGAAECELRI